MSATLMDDRSHVSRIDPAPSTRAPMYLPAPGAGGRRWPFTTVIDDAAIGADALPEDLLERAVRRVQIAAGVYAGLWAFALVMNDLVSRFPGMRGRPESWPPSSDVLAAIGCASWLAFLWAARKLRARPVLVIDLSLAVFVLTAFLAGIVTNWFPVFHGATVSWIALAIMIFPAIAPTTVRKTLIAAFLAAAMDPLGMVIAGIRGVPLEYDVHGMLWRYLPTFIAAGVSVIPVSIIRGLGREVTRERELGSYRIGERLGRGGMGEVYRATHRMLARPAAIKLVHLSSFGGPATLEDHVAAERFRREAATAANLRSAHTIELYDYGVAPDGTLYYVMELLEGVDLEQLVQRFGPVPPERAVHLLSQLCESLAEAHAMGLLHRDVKPSNVLTCRLGVTVDFVKVLDFGLVATCQRAPKLPEAALTSPGLLVGTPGFMAPETLGTGVVDQRADVYGIGCVAFWLLTGRAVFDATNAFALMLRHVQDQPEPPSAWSPFRVASELDALVLDCLAKDPDARPYDAGEVAERLASCPSVEPWTQSRARAWWEEHIPPAPQPVDPLRLDTPPGTTGREEASGARNWLVEIG